MNILKGCVWVALFSLHQYDGWVNIVPMDELDLEAAPAAPLAEI